MTLKGPEHRKHAALAKPAYGNFARIEWAILGTTCSRIRALATALTASLSDRFSLAYADADHHEATPAEPTLMTAGARLEFTDKIQFKRLDLVADPSPYDFRNWFSHADAVLVNGNHFEAKAQIVVLDPIKMPSLERKLSRLTDVQLILTTEELPELPDFLRTHLGEHAGAIPCWSITDLEKTQAWIHLQLEAAIAPCYGLVLAGGQSMRMGADKGQLKYHGRPQREHLAELLSACCRQTFLSCREDQLASLPANLPAIADTFTGLGPFGALLSAFRAHPDAAWLVVACDLPLLDLDSLEELIAGRDPAALATAFRHPDQDFPEPLIAIWEPRAYPALLRFLSQGVSCPRKVLINSRVRQLQPLRPEVLTNVNTEEEFRQVMAMLHP